MNSTTTPSKLSMLSDRTLATRGYSLPEIQIRNWPYSASLVPRNIFDMSLKYLLKSNSICSGTSFSTMPQHPPSIDYSG